MRPWLRVISGGQTGVDRAALDAALEAGLALGGACPAGRWAEGGPIPPRYPLQETVDADPAARTRLNVRDGDATLILVSDPRPATWGPGTRLTAEAAVAFGRPLRVVIPVTDDNGGIADLVRWLLENRVAVLNVAGPRESEAPGCYARARAFLVALFAGLERAISPPG